MFLLLYKFGLSIIGFIDYLFLSNLCVSLISLMKSVDVNPNDEWVNVSKHSTCTANHIVHTV